MKLANALSQRSELQERIRQLEGRLQNNARVQEGETPAEDPAELLAELDRCVDSLEELMGRINLTNSRTRVGEYTLTELIARRDCLTLKVSAYRDFLREASRTAQRATRSEIRIHSTVPVAQLQKTVDRMARELRLLDNQIQQTNWTTEL